MKKTVETKISQVTFNKATDPKDHFEKMLTVCESLYGSKIYQEYTGREGTIVFAFGEDNKVFIESQYLT